MLDLFYMINFTLTIKQFILLGFHHIVLKVQLPVGLCDMKLKEGESKFNINFYKLISQRAG